MINTTEASISACIGIISGVIICVILFWPKTETCIPTKKVLRTEVRFRGV